MSMYHQLSATNGSKPYLILSSQSVRNQSPILIRIIAVCCLGAGTVPVPDTGTGMGTLPQMEYPCIIGGEHLETYPNFEKTQDSLTTRDEPKTTLYPLRYDDRLLPSTQSIHAPSPLEQPLTSQVLLKIQSNSEPIESKIEGWSINGVEHHTST
ncbi:hypothetical protein A2U01_0017963 [Trifolium medium]|uniref:Uncharacterized protein n=1 Tax=Trifolium medium TaxID=97028 RepID=A0A392NBX2_9FABA|nr:hypothetical protein [Trifolium medium]